MIRKIDPLTEAEVPAPPDAWRVDRGDYIRASGDCPCEVCGFPYWQHDHVTGYRWLTRACDGRLLKL